MQIFNSALGTKLNNHELEGSQVYIAKGIGRCVVYTKTICFELSPQDFGGIKIVGNNQHRPTEMDIFFIFHVTNLNNDVE